MASLIGVYNYKGGVGKTTNVIQLGATLAGLGRRVLLVDADPQCNLTTFFAPTEEAEDTGEMDFGLPDGTILEDQLAQVNPTEIVTRVDHQDPSIYSLLRPIFDGEGGVNLDTPNLLDQTSVVNLFLLRGSAALIRFETRLAQAANAPAVSFHTRLLGAFRNSLLAIANQNQINHILIDFGPSSGIMNKVFVLSCDFILPPAFADYFSLSSIDGLLYSVLNDWFRWQQTTVGLQVQGRENLGQPHPFEFNGHLPRILPFLITSYKI